MFDGIINVYKEQGYTSFDVVAKLRGILKQKKIGHTGTLDPMAEGVLMVCLGKATKLVDMITAKDKEYKAVLRLGITTDTEDISGKVLQEDGISPNITKDQIESVIMSFVGSYDQIPPMYSAIKKDGKKLYEYARQGIEVERTPRPVTIFSIDNINITLPTVSFDVHCSKGTYIRSLCRDIGERLGCGGTMEALVRSHVQSYDIDDSLKLSQIEELAASKDIEKYILPVDALLSQYKRYDILEKHSKYLLNGNKLYINQMNVHKDTNTCFMEQSLRDKELVRVYKNDEFLALYEYNKEQNLFAPYKMFLG
ncbi:MAG: tRNA pseudouridine(55) synthase TruB [Lachnospiraceae bacterium]|nr:tRNA pseudouridine(55) synthase TruB [Lachnospiraceae bacterium]